MHKKLLGNLITESSSLFKQCIYAHTVLALGRNAVSDISDEVFVEATVGLNTKTEPIPMSELKNYRQGLQNILLVMFHGKLVNVWNDCLSQLFKFLVGLHFSGRRHFKELKKRSLQLDFQQSNGLEEQVKDRLCRDFEFQKYNDRVKLLNSVFNPNKEGSEHISNIVKNVQIRNSFQHRGGIVDSFLLNELGLKRISLISSDGHTEYYSKDAPIELSIGEFDAFKRSLLLMGQIWRKWNV